MYTCGTSPRKGVSMRFESLVWTLLALFLVGGSVVGTDTLVTGVNTGGREYQSADGDVKIPPPLMDPGSTTTAAAQLTK
jgi:hypothetical protein